MPKLMGLPSAPGLATEGIAQQLEATQAAGQRTQNLLQARQKEQSRVTQIKKPGSMPQTRSASLLGG